MSRHPNIYEARCPNEGCDEVIRAAEGDEPFNCPTCDAELEGVEWEKDWEASEWGDEDWDSKPGGADDVD